MAVGTNVTITIDGLAEVLGKLDLILTKMGQIGQSTGIEQALTVLSGRSTLIEQRVRAIQASVDRDTISSIEMENLMSDLSAVVDDLVARVQGNTDVIASASATLSTLGARVADLVTQLEQAGVDPAIVAQLAALGTVISDDDDTLAAAIAASTPAAPPTP